jgi:hypothetical protein
MTDPITVIMEGMRTSDPFFSYSWMDGGSILGISRYYIFQYKIA